MNKHILYAAEFSLYSGKTRSYLRYKLSLPFISPEDIFKRLGEHIDGGARQRA